MTHPYSDLPPKAFWKTGVVQTDKARWPDVFTPKFQITPYSAIATAGSCFAQRIRQALAGENIPILDAEPTPPEFNETLAKEFGYGLHSARYGNIYTPRQLLELLKDVADNRVDEALFWQKDQRFFDALRPNVEPEGCVSLKEAVELRYQHLARVKALVETADVFVFTLGLTEAWIHLPTGRTLPVAPGVIAGEYDPELYKFTNFTHAQMFRDLKAIRRLFKRFNRGLKLVLTTSPVPITATASGQHVLVASTYTKSTLRSVAGEIAMKFHNVDYFPGYELVTTWGRDDAAYAPNLRTIRPEVVAEVMAIFLDAYGLRQKEGTAGAVALKTPQARPFEGHDEDRDEDSDDNDADDDLVCEEILLEAFQK
ncbi:GSCFA domain-containing protein [Celeribacter baekdonensis]|uniref:GSCFA family protein n=1 Tax=Celeribacter baekdonensis TaxID=875171 RepID=A0A2R4M0Z7_9RHOB|nr:GSCFA domain-containing protein [Celeribacter baekdonensis]AVW90845.1 GSCFA family protein [Celeribacter baekdonensis]